MSLKLSQWQYIQYTCYPITWLWIFVAKIPPSTPIAILSKSHKAARDKIHPVPLKLPQSQYIQYYTCWNCPNHNTSNTLAVPAFTPLVTKPWCLKENVRLFCFCFLLTNVRLAGQIRGQMSVCSAWNALPNNVEHKVEAIMEPFRSPAGDRTWIL